MICANMIAFGKAASGGWQNPYVCDMMNHMWDGIWNVVAGKSHDPTATSWNDIVGGMTLTKRFSNSYISTFEGGNALVTPSESKTNDSASGELYHTGEAVMSGATALTMEIVFDAYATTADCALAFLWNAATNAVPRLGFNRQSSGSQYSSITPVINAPASSSTYYQNNPNWTKDNVRYCAVTIDVSGNIKFYWNGTAGVTSLTGTSGMVTYIAPLSLIVVGRNYGTVKHYGVRTHLRDLTAEEIAYNYSIDKARFGLS